MSMGQALWLLAEIWAAAALTTAAVMFARWLIRHAR